ncbi:MAG: DUF454 domain-containing protein [Tissierellia bacterium]|nr:DUF454 domain-containing protein [Tissierellia bacterium]
MGIKNLLLTIAGLIALILGGIGAFIPVWPTTPFVIFSFGLLSATPNIQKRILKIEFFREYLESYHEKKGISKRTLIFSLIFLWSMLFISIYKMNNMHMTVLLVVIGIGVTIHIAWVSRDRRKKNGRKQ